MTDMEGRFWANVDKRAADECWLWKGPFSGAYGRFSWNGRSVPAHRKAWEIANGQDMDAPCACHSCDNPPCVNPNHISPGTQAENMRQESERRRIHGQQKTHCPAGHPFTEDNLAKSRRHRECRICHNARQKSRSLEYRNRKRAERAAASGDPIGFAERSAAAKREMWHSPASRRKATEVRLQRTLGWIPADMMPEYLAVRRKTNAVEAKALIKRRIAALSEGRSHG